MGLADAPVALITSQWGYSAKMENAYASQGQDITMSASKTLELNPDHPVIHEVWKKIEADPEDAGAKETAELLTQTAILASGYRLQDPRNVVKSVHNLLMAKRGVDMNVEVKQIEPEVEPEIAESVHSTSWLTRMEGKACGQLLREPFSGSAP